MAQSSLEMFEEEFNEMSGTIGHLIKDANAKSVYLVDKDGQLIASVGEVEGVDATSLASLTAGNIAATGGLAKLLGEKEFSILFHEGEKDNIHISIVEQRIILVVIFDDRSSLGLVRLRVRKAGEEIGTCIQKVLKRMESSVKETLLEEISDDDIEDLFK